MSKQIAVIWHPGRSTCSFNGLNVSPADAKRAVGGTITPGEPHRFRLRRVRSPIGAIVIRRSRVNCYQNYDISLGPGSTYSACGSFQRVTGLRMKPGEVRFYKYCDGRQADD